MPVGYDEQGVAVAGVTVWSAGPGKPGLLEPMGVHAEHRRRGHGRKICVAAAAELTKLGSPSALVCTQSSLTGAVATYKSAGSSNFLSGWTEHETLDRQRDRDERVAQADP